MAKKIFALALFMSTFLCFSLGFASSIGNPIKPLGNMKLSAGIEANFIRERDMEESGSSTTGSSINSLELTECSQGYTLLTLGITDYANIFAKLGMAKINSINLKFSSGESVSLESSSGLLYGGGATIVYTVGREDLYFLDKFIDIESDINCFLGLKAEATYFQADADEMYIDSVNVTNVSGKLKNLQTQLALFGGAEFMIDDNLSLSPYITGFWNNSGIKTDGVRYNTDILNFDSDAEDQFGVGLGLDLNLSKNVTFNIEGRFIGGNEISFGGTLKF